MRMDKRTTLPIVILLCLGLSMAQDVVKVNSSFLPPATFAKVMFLHLSVSHSVHGGVVSQHALQVSRPTPKGEVEGDLAMEGSPGPHLGGLPVPGGVPAPGEVPTPGGVVCGYIPQ